MGSSSILFQGAVGGLLALAAANLAIMVAMCGGPLLFLQMTEQAYQPPLRYVPRELAGLRVYVTGANRGLGYSIAQVLMEAGATVSVCARTKAKADAAVEALQAEGVPGSARGIGIDFSDLSSIDQFVDMMKSERGSDLDRPPLDALILNAGVAGVYPVDERTGLNPVVGVNFIGTAYLVQKLVELGLVNQASRIVVVTSGAHLMGKPFVYPGRENSTMSNASFMYAQSKLLALTWFQGLLWSLPNDKSPHVCYWNPGPVDTDLGSDSVPPLVYPTYWMMKRIFFVDPYEVAKTAHFLLVRGGKSGAYLHMRKFEEMHPWTSDHEGQVWATEKLHEAILSRSQAQ